MFPDGNYGDCCEEHDKDYSLSGTKTRKQADKDLYLCIKDKAGVLVASVVYAGVRTFGWMFWKKTNFGE